MTTQNGYSGSGGEVTVTISASNVSAIAAFTTAETIAIKGVLREARRTNNPAYQRASLPVADGGQVTTYSRTKDDGGEDWELVLIDDYWKGDAGEYGTDLLSAVEIFKEFFDADELIGGLSFTPAGGKTGHMETSLLSPIKVLSVGKPEISADKAEAETVGIMIGAAGSQEAAHA